MTSRWTQWQGTETESRELVAAVSANCTCPEQATDENRCPAHQALLDQRFLNGLLFARRLRECLIREEWTGWG
jgi:hypothetical protein